MNTPANRSNTVRLLERKANSPAFKAIYSEGMGLVEETAAYLDGEGRRAAKELDRPATSLYAAESMRLTTRLMQVASWLLLQRSLNNGEMNRTQVLEERAKIRLDTASSGEDVPFWSELPDEFTDLVYRSIRLQDRVRDMDSELFGDREPEDIGDADNPVMAQINLLKTAFGDT